MQNLAATKNKSGSGNLNVIYSQFSASLLIMIVMSKNFFLTYSFTQLQSKDKKLTQISLNVIDDTPNFCFKGRRDRFSRDGSCWRRKILLVLHCVNVNRIFVHWTFSKSLKFERQRECLSMVRRMLPSSRQVVLSEIKGPRYRTTDTRLFSCLVCLNIRALHLSFHVFLAGTEWFKLGPKSSQKFLSWKTTILRLPE